MASLPSLGYNPGGFELSKKKLKHLLEISNFNKIQIKYVVKKTKLYKHTLLSGDTQMAKVLSLSPLNIAIYSDEFDSALILNFPESLAKDYNLQIGQKLVSCNSYWPLEGFEVEKDIVIGESCSYNFRDVLPLLPTFLANDIENVSTAIEIFPKEYWDYFDELIEVYKKVKPSQTRDGIKVFLRF